MGSKAVVFLDAKTVLTDKSCEFQEKHLCDGIIINLGERNTRAAFSVRDLAWVNHAR